MESDDFLHENESDDNLTEPTPESNVDKLLPLAAYVISETASQDGKVGGPIQTVKITSDGGGVTLSPEDINNIVSSNTDRSKKLRSMFFGE